MTRTSLKSLITRAARLLEEEAKVQRESCENTATGAPWACQDCNSRTCHARRVFEKLTTTARELRNAAAKGIRA